MKTLKFFNKTLPFVRKHLVFIFALCFFAPNVHARRIAYYFYMDNNDKHIYEDENVKVCMVSDIIYVYNKTSQIIYIDKANSFAVLNGKHYTMFSNSVTTSGISGNSGIGVNLGMISPYLNGISVSGGRGIYNQTATYEKRIYSLPPKTWVGIWTWNDPFSLMASDGHIIDNGNKFLPLTPRSRYVERGKKIKLTKGFVRTFEYNNSPLRYKH
ncbi:MAG: hypothetical protein J1F13_00190 [Prevotellaceae bacterium]|nr:hypothetical protein [Prevotellaceae bacterium]